MIVHSRPFLGKREIDIVVEVIGSSMLIDGETCHSFRHALDQLTGRDNSATLFASGRTAIQAALKALDLPPGSGVVLQSYVCDAVIWAILEAGHYPVFCDIGEGWTAGVEQVQAVFTTNCRAIILAPPFGFRQIATDFRQFEVPIIHDLCQASPNILTDASAESMGDILSFSFHPTKYLCGGGGGAIVDMTGIYCENLRVLERKFNACAPFTEIQAALAMVQLARVGEFESRRANIFDLYIDHAHSAITARMMEHIDVQPGAMFRFPLNITKGDVKSVFSALYKDGILARHGVDQLAHRSFGLDDKKFPNSLRALRKTISLPFYPALSDTEVSFVAEKIANLQ